jgi:signal transduction histidine kinase
VLRVGQERRKYYEMTMSETAIAERRRVSRFIHDHLGHNLGYLHLKLDQLVSQKNLESHETIENDLEHLRSAAYESYEFVRGTLETLHRQTTPQLTNQLSEYAHKIARRADFKIEFMTTGKPVVLPIEVNQAIFYAFEEALSNIEKYARASKVDVCVEWGAEGVELRISDDGIGFDADKVNTDRHFGLGILRERMEKVFGQVTLNTSENSGTVVSIRVPNSPVHRLGASL